MEKHFVAPVFYRNLSAILSAGVMAISLSIVGCSSESAVDGVESRPFQAQCSGAKCDGWTFDLPALETRELHDLFQCTVRPDADEGEDPFYAYDGVFCQFYLPAKDVVGIGFVSTQVSYDGGAIDELVLARNADFSGQLHRIGSIHGTSYPATIRIRIDLKLPSYVAHTVGREVRTTKATVGLEWELEVDRRPESEEVIVEQTDYPLVLWPVRIWPSKAFEENWQQGSERRLGFRLDYVQTVAPSDTNHDYTYRFNLIRRSNPDLSAMVDQTLYLPIARNLNPEVRFGLSLDDNPPASSVISGPGYYLIDGDGKLRLATPDEVRQNGIEVHASNAPLSEAGSYPGEEGRVLDAQDMSGDAFGEDQF